MCAWAHAIGAEPLPSYEIHAAHISTHALIAAFASAFRINVVTGDELGNRVLKVDERAIAADAFLEQIASANGLTVRDHQGIFLVASACRLGQTPGRESHAAYKEKLSMFFQDVGAGTIIRDVFGARLQRPLDASVSNLDSAMIHHVRERPEWDHLVAMSMVQGWRIQDSSQAAVNIVHNEQIAACAGTHVFSPVATVATTLEDESTCPPEAPPSPNCNRLEFYRLNQLKPLGFLRKLPQSALIAMVEAPDKLAYYLTLGSRIGPDFGRIIQITKRGIKVREMYMGKDRFWRERTVWLNFPT